MKTRHLFFVVIFIMVLSCISLDAQKIDSIPPVCLNGVTIFLDTVTYRDLFNSSFLSDTLGICEAHTVTTVDAGWSGRYLLGEEGYLEFFQPDDLNKAYKWKIRSLIRQYT